MSQTKKTVFFFLSFFITIILVSLSFQSISSLIVDKDQSVMFNIISPLFTSIGLFIFALMQALMKYMSNRKALTTNTNLVSANINKFNIRERLLFCVFLILIYAVPVFGRMVFDYTFMLRILFFVGSIIIVEMLLRISNKNTKVFFQRNGILITGFDVRIEIPFGRNIDIYNSSGFYSYRDIEEYSVFPDHMELSLINDYGKIVFMTSGELKRQVTGLMVQNKIPVKKVSE